jgi:rare lipoprotein A
MNVRVITGAALLLTVSGAAFAGSEVGSADEAQGRAEPLVEQHGDASFYADSFRGQKTANGEIFRQDGLTAASRDLPLGTVVTVTNAVNGKSVNVKVNDRGPFKKGRVIDLSKRAAAQIGLRRQRGIVPVKVVARPSHQPTEELRRAVSQQAAAQAKGRYRVAASCGVCARQLPVRDTYRDIEDVRSAPDVATYQVARNLPPEPPQLPDRRG